MANPVCEVLRTKEELERPLEQPDVSAGAIVDFRGVVRSMEGEQMIRGIAYEAHREMAQHQLTALATETMRRFGLNAVIIRHRVGFVPVGETSLLARVAAPHRQAAFEAIEWLVDELKKKVPIWKHPELESTPSQFGAASLQREESLPR